MEPTDAQNQWTAVVDIVADLCETSGACQAFLRATLSVLNEHQLSTTAVGIRTEDWYHRLNLAAFCVWRNKLIFLAIVLEKAPSLLWQRFLGGTENLPLTTPLDVAAYSRSPALFSYVLGHGSLVAYAKQRPVEYALLTDRCGRLCNIWFGERPSSYEMLLIMGDLGNASRRALFSYASTILLIVETPQKINRLMLPLVETYCNPPAYVRHIDLYIMLDAAKLIQQGGTVEAIAQECLGCATELLAFLQDESSVSEERVDKLDKKIPHFLERMTELRAFGATHFYNVIMNREDGEKTLLYLRFMRLNTLTGASCA